MSLLVRSLLCSGLAGLLAASLAGAAEGGKKSRAEASADFFTNTTLRRFHIEIPRADLGKLRQNEHTYVRATIKVDELTLRDVGIRLKGNGTFRPVYDKPSFSVKFDEFVAGQKMAGLKKLMLNNGKEDDTYLGEYIATGLCRDAGLPASRVTHTRVSLNGRDLGLYVAIEAMNKDFLKHEFGDGSGDLYEGFMQDIDRNLEQDNGEDVSRADVQALIAAAREPDPTRRLAGLGQTLDTDRFLSFTAMEMLIGHWDGYAGKNRNNYRLYHNPRDGRLVFIPHGMDSTFGNPGCSDATPLRSQGVMPPMNALTIRALLTAPGQRQKYRGRFGELLTNVFRVAVVTNRIHAATERLLTLAKPEEADEIKEQSAAMAARIRERAAFLAAALREPEPVTLQFNSDGVARLTGWRSRVDEGAIKSARVNDDGHDTFFIRADGPRGVGSWRLRVLLDQGRYRFTAQARAVKLAPLANDALFGAGIRVEGGRRYNRLSGDTGWTPLTHPLRVEHDGTEVELVCELRAFQGEVWYDADSLKLVRE